MSKFIAKNKVDGNALRGGGVRGRHARRLPLAATVAVVFLALGVLVPAGDLLRSGAANSVASAGGATGSANALNAVNAANVAAAQRARDTLARTTQILQAMQTAQGAAHALAAAGPNYLVTHPVVGPSQTLLPVPNGMVAAVPGVSAGGLVPDSGLAAPGVANPVTTWVGASTPVQTTVNGAVTVDIQQTAQQALLNWATFNVGQSTTVSFHQGGADWVALNRIMDSSLAPSQILGTIKAPGAVYVINQNGIIFGGSSQVNTRTLVASSLPINQNLVTRGLLNNPDSQFLFSSLTVPVLAAWGGTGGVMPTFTPPAAPLGYSGEVEVQAGARIVTDSTLQHIGGLVALIGPNVQNAGSITTPDGQTILAAGQQVAWFPHASGDPSLRGLDVLIGAVTDPAAPAAGGVAINSGLIEAPRASISMNGRDVRQLGVVDSLTSVSLNGRVDLLANYDATYMAQSYTLSPRSVGVVTLGPGSVTQILPDWASADAVVGTVLSLPSQINLQGAAIHLGANSTLLAPNANVALNAGGWVSSTFGGTYRAYQQNVFFNTQGQVYLDAGATIDVSGSTDVSVALTRNLVQVQLRGAELADSPLQRNGVLRGKTVTVDMRQSGTFNGVAWVGSPIGNLLGYQNLIQRGVGELTSAGGSVTIAAGEAVVMQPGSGVNVSGGWINYQGGVMQTTKAVSGGVVYDMAQATPDRVYNLITPVFPGALSANGASVEAGYLQGANAGSLTITAPAMTLDGTLLGSRTIGPRQRASAPLSGALTLAIRRQVSADPSRFYWDSPTPPNAFFRSVSAAPADPFALDVAGLPVPLRADRKALLELTPDLINLNGFGRFSLDNADGIPNGSTAMGNISTAYAGYYSTLPPVSGSVTLPAGAFLRGPAGGSISLIGSNIRIDGGISMPGGSVALSSRNELLLNPIIVDTTASVYPLPGRGMINLGSAASISTAGLMVDDRFGSPGAESLPLVTDGGGVAIKGLNVNLAPGSSVDVSGGVALSTTGKAIYGKGGSITFDGGRDPFTASVMNPGGFFPGVPSSDLTMGGTLNGLAGGRGGSLNIVVPLAQVGGSAPAAGVLWIQPDFFNQGGFSSFSLTALMDTLTIAPGTVIAPMVRNAQLDPGGSFSLVSTLFPQGLRTAANLTFSDSGGSSPFGGVVVGGLVLGDGAHIQTDPGGAVTLGGKTVAVFGSVVAPGGRITISGSRKDNVDMSLPGWSDYVSTTYNWSPTVDLGANSRLDVAGTTLFTPNAYGYRTGAVLPGGAISVSGHIFAEAGSVLDVSGASGVLDIAPAFGSLNLNPAATSTRANLLSVFGVQSLTPTRVDSNGGSISLSGGSLLYSDATLIGRAGGSSAQGGSLTVSSGPANTFTPLPTDNTLVLTQSGSVVPGRWNSARLPGQNAIGNYVVDALGNPVAGPGFIAADSFNNGGFDAVTLKGVVRFKGAVTLAANRSLTVANGGVLLADPSAASSLTLNAPYVALGLPFPTLPAPLIFSATDPASALALQRRSSQIGVVAPTWGAGSITANATLVDLGSLSLQNVGTATFNALNGEIRGSGIFDIAGTLNMTAGVIYPTTEAAFTTAAYNDAASGTTGTINLFASGRRPLPLSAGGQLNVYASVINQGGTLSAPIGTINLGLSPSAPAADQFDPLAGRAFPTASAITLKPGGATSVSAVDPITGQGLTLPYGALLNGVQWIDPAGVDITLGLAPAKAVKISATAVDIQTGSTVDVRGGGDLDASQWVQGLGGSRDILAGSSSFAVIPGYGGLGGDLGFSGSGLAVGDQVHLAAGGGLAEGTYVLLPARYALLPGAFLVTPKSGAPLGNSLAMADASTLVSGYRFNGLGRQTGQPLIAQFEVASAAVVHARAEYQDFSANSWLKNAATARGLAAPRLPVDAGQIQAVASAGLGFGGTVLGSKPSGGRGSLVDLAGSANILIAGPGGGAGFAGLVLRSSFLNAIGAESLLVGGYRTVGPNGTAVTVLTPNLTLNNAGAPLTGMDVTLAATTSLTLSPGADLESLGTSSVAADTLLFGNASVAGSGNGVLARVSGNSSAPISRSGVNAATQPRMAVGGGGVGATIAGTSVTLDSTAQTAFDGASTVTGNNFAFNSGQISLQFANADSLFSDATHPVTTGLVLSQSALNTLLANAQALSLSSYSALDLYGNGTVGDFNAGAFSIQDFALHAGEIRGFNNGNGPITFNANRFVLDNAFGGSAPGAVLPTMGGSALTFHAGTLRLGVNNLAVDQYAQLTLQAENGLLLQDKGSLSTPGALAVTTPIITGITGGKPANQTITAGGAFTLARGGSTAAPVGRLGAILNLVGVSISDSTDIVLPSGLVTLHATGTGGNIALGGRLDVGGLRQNFYDLAKYTDGGQIRLISDSGSIALAPGSAVSVAATTGGGKGGTLSLSAANGVLNFAGTLAGQGGGTVNDVNGIFALDIGGLASLANLDAALNAGSFTQSRSFRVRTGDVAVDGPAVAHHYTVSADQGAITVTSSIDAHGPLGGAISLYANQGVTLASGSSLTAAGAALDHAGKAGVVDLETRGAGGGVIDIRAGSTLDLSIAGGPGGTLYLRAPQVAGFSDVAINPIAGTLVNPGSVVVEGFRSYAYNQPSLTMDPALRAAVANDATSFAGNSVTPGGTAAIKTRLLAGDPTGIMHVRPGVEIVNSGEDLVLASDWQFAALRFGPTADPALLGSGEPGTLTLRATGNLVLQGALSDGFAPGADPRRRGTQYYLWEQPLLAAGSRSWSYRLVAGADASAADFHQVKSPARLGATSGSLQLGRNLANPTTSWGAQAWLTDVILQGGVNYYQVVRTGTGNIDIATGRDVLLLNPFATIYTAGTQVANPTVLPGGAFDLPVTLQWMTAVRRSIALAGSENIGPFPAPNTRRWLNGWLYPAQYSVGGGNVNIAAGQNIAHETQDPFGHLVLDSQDQLPNNWLYRRSNVAVNGQFGSGNMDPATGHADSLSTTWWVSFMSFFQGVGALGGGNLSMVAGNDILNVDGSVPTNARMPKGTPNAANLVELGGGDLLVQAGHDINGGAYYIEKGKGTLVAGNSILTNSKRTPSTANYDSVTASYIPILASWAIPTSDQWLPTTLFLGKGSFDLFARGDLTLGSVANVFMLPQGLSNQNVYKTAFSTYAPDDSVNASSLTGAVTFRTGLGVYSTSLLENFIQNVQQTSTSTFNMNVTPLSWFQPWLRTLDIGVLGIPGVAQFDAAMIMLPPTLRATAFSGDIRMDGDLRLAPSRQGTVDFAAAGAVSGLRKDPTTVSYSTLILSDADPANVPGIANPTALVDWGRLPVLPTAANGSTAVDLSAFNPIFSESGAVGGTGYWAVQASTVQFKQKLHANIPLDPANPLSPLGTLHAGDTSPLRLYSLGDDISGLTLFSGKATQVSAGRDLFNVAFYIQNVRASDISAITAGRDIIPYSSSAVAPLAGDLQINGPGTLEVLAGRNLDLGVGPSRADGVGMGITSVGNARNPYLPYAGANLVVGAGLGAGGGTGLDGSRLDFASFNGKFLNPATAGANAPRYLPDLGAAMGLVGANNAQVWTAFQALSLAKQDQLALDIFYHVVRDAGRDKVMKGGAYENGYLAIATLFPGAAWDGKMALTSREIKTKNGGDISLLTPGGGLDVGLTLPAGVQPADQGIFTEGGGNISIFARDSVNLGTSRIFTLSGGNEILWSTLGNIAAGASSKTVMAAPPTRVLIDPQTAAVRLDLAGLATGGGIGVLQSTPGAPLGNVDLVAPIGAVDAGDAGVRVSGNLNIAASVVLNADNIKAGGVTTGAPAPAAPAEVSGAATTVTTAKVTTGNDAGPKSGAPHDIFTVEVIAFGDDVPPDPNEAPAKRKKLTRKDDTRDPDEAALVARR